MNNSRFIKWLPAGLALVGAILLLAWWLTPGGRERTLTERIPGADRSGSNSVAGGIEAKLEGRLIKSNGVPSTIVGAWPRFRGTNLDNISTDPTPLAKTWPATGPKVLWSIDVGEGFAGAAIWNGRVYVMDYDREKSADALRCLSLDDGREIWRFTYPVKIKRNHGMTRTVPVVTDKYVISIGPKCHVTCLDPMTGELHWMLDMVKEFNTEVPPWYAGQCPLIDGNLLILGTGGDALVTAVDCATGKIVWKSPNPNNWQMTHSSVMPMEFNGQRMYVYCGSGGVSAVSAKDGALLWDSPDWKISIASVPSPVPVGAGRVFLSGGYNAGAAMFQLKADGDKIKAEIAYRLKPAVFGATQHTPVFFDNHLFGIRPDGQFACIDLSGKPVWESGPAHRFGNGPFLFTKEVVFMMNDNGLLTMAETSTTGYKQLAQAKVLEGPDSWGPMALAGGRLIIRDLNKMICLDVAAK
jgi:outer membrane protein assembly factor BamB